MNGPELVEGAEGSPEAKKRLQGILEALEGRKTLLDVATELGMREAMIHRLKTRVIQAALESLEPKPLGRPSMEGSAERKRIEELEKENEDLKEKLQASELREVIVRDVPELIPRLEKKKKPHDAR